jgi:hypothetical protein
MKYYFKDQSYIYNNINEKKVKIKKKITYSLISDNKVYFSDEISEKKIPFSD